MGTFNNNASVVTLQQSPTAGIPWLVQLTPVNASFGGGTYTMHAGSEVSFLWTWTSVAQPAQGGYGFVNCVYAG